MKIKNIVFFFPSKQTGGAQYLFIRYSIFLCKYAPQYKVMYVDYADGFAKKQLMNENVFFYEYKQHSKIRIPNDSVVIFQLNRISDFKNEIEYDVQHTSFMFWYLHVTNLHDQVFARGVYLLNKKDRKKIGNCIDYLIDNDTIKLMGKTDYFDFNKDFFIGSHDVDIIPYILPIDNFPAVQLRTTLSLDSVRFCWLGRLDEEKSRNIVTYFNEIEELHKQYSVSLSIIGVGPAMSLLKAEAKKYSFPIFFVGEKRDAELDSYIRNNVDIGLASGTSSLEFGFRGVPVIEQWVISQIYNSGECRDYTHVYDRYKYDERDLVNKINVTQNTFLNKFEEIISNYSATTQKSYEFSIQYTPETGGKKFLDSIRKLECLYSVNSVRSIDIMSSLLIKANLRREFLSRAKQILSLRTIRELISK